MRPVIHDDDEIGERQRLVLAVRHVHEADAELALEALQLLAHAHAQERVERGQRLVEQQHAGIGDERARKRHTLLLPAGELRRQPLRLRLHLDKAQHLMRLGAARDFRHTAHAQAEGDVVDAIEMRKERVILKHHRGTPSRRRQSGHARAADEDVAAGRSLVPGDHAQRRRLAAA